MKLDIDEIKKRAGIFEQEDSYWVTTHLKPKLSKEKDLNQQLKLVWQWIKEGNMTYKDFKWLLATEEGKSYLRIKS